MKQVCAWCLMIIKEGFGDVSHGICVDCENQLNEDIDKYYLKELP